MDNDDYQDLSQTFPLCSKILDIMGHRHPHYKHHHHGLDLQNLREEDHENDEHLNEIYVNYADVEFFLVDDISSLNHRSSHHLRFHLHYKRFHEDLRKIHRRNV